jgi:Fe2+ or Zn2+ uptake regulation protein
MQRRLVLEAVLRAAGHPTAEQIHRELAARSDRISRATVHRTLETLVGMGLIDKTCHHGAVTRYDARTVLHHHLICQHCDAVIDFDDPGFDALAVPDTAELGFTVTDVRVQLRGVCRECRARSDQGPGP